MCLSFIGGCINIIKPDKIKLFDHDDEDRTLCSIFDDASPVKVSLVKSSDSTKFLSRFDRYPEKRLVSPRNILISNGRGTMKLYHHIKSSKSGFSATHCSNMMHNLGGDSHGVVQYLDAKRSKLVNFGGITPDKALQSANRINEYDIKTEEWTTRSDSKLKYKRGFMSLCKIDASQLAIIGGKTYDVTLERTVVPRTYDPHYTYSTSRRPLHRPIKQTEGDNYKYEYKYNKKILDSVELYNLETGEVMEVQHMNHERWQCCSYYSRYSNEIIVCGGSNDHQWCNPKVVDKMEIYDCHKNIWRDIPWKMTGEDCFYPCIWTVGSKCIFVSHSIDYAKMKGQWIDLRECNCKGRSSSMFRPFEFRINGCSEWIHEYSVFSEF